MAGIRDIRAVIVSLIFLGLLASSCSPGGDQADPTVQALAEAVALTATANAAGAFNSAANLATAEARATEVGQSLIATQTAQASLSEADRAATATAFAPFSADLPNYGVDPTKGRPGWIHPPLEINIEGYHTYDYGNRFIGTVADDFVVSADITWNTRFGTSGCGFVLRSDGNEDGLNQHLVIATRAALGHIIFSTMADGEVVNGYDMYAYGLDPEFDWHNDTTNRLTVVGVDNKFSIYTNGTMVGEIIPEGPPQLPPLPSPPTEPPPEANAQQKASYNESVEEYNDAVARIRAEHREREAAYNENEARYDRGLIAMVALNESGYTNCRFDNAWLWLMD